MSSKMEKKKRQRQLNPQPFLPNDTDDSVSIRSSKQRSKPPKLHQKQSQVISSGISSKILKEALVQQREIEEEEEERENSSAVAFKAAAEEENVAAEVAVEEEDIDEFQGFDDRSQFGVDDEIDENDEKLLEAFFNTDARPQRTLADVIAAKLRETDSAPKLDKSVIELYKGLGEFLSKYTAGKMPKTFKHIPAMTVWEDVLHLTEPEKWSPNAMYQATRIFASNLNLTKASRFYKLVLLPRIRDDIKKHKRLHFALYQSLKKALYKPAAFNKGILLPLCQSGTCSLREAVIVGSILQKVSIPMLHSGVALLKLAEMEYCGTTSYFIKLLFEKKYALPYRVVDAVVAHYMRFLEDSRTMPVIWHQSLLAFVQRYKNELTKVDKDNLRTLVRKQKHGLVTPEILRELDNSRNRGEKEDPMLTKSPVSVINNTIEEDRFDIPDVPMED